AEVRERRVRQRQPREVRAAELEHARAELEAVGGRPHITEVGERQEETPRRCSGQPGRRRDLARSPDSPPVERSDDGEAALERLHERGTAVACEGRGAVACRGGGRGRRGYRRGGSTAPTHMYLISRNSSIP